MAQGLVCALYMALYLMPLMFAEHGRWCQDSVKRVREGVLCACVHTCMRVCAVELTVEQTGMLISSLCCTKANAKIGPHV